MSQITMAVFSSHGHIRSVDTSGTMRKSPYPVSQLAYS
jgi:hypothetical protein